MSYPPRKPGGSAGGPGYSGPRAPGPRPLGSHPPRPDAKPVAGRPDHRGPRPAGPRASDGSRADDQPGGPRAPGPRPPGSHPPRPDAKPVAGRPDQRGPRPAGPRANDGPRADDRPRGDRAPSGPRLPDAPRGAVWLYGLHAVDAALGNPSRRLRRLILTEEAEAALLARRPPPWPLTPERSERARIDQLLGRDAVHQGMALLADPLGTPLLANALERPGPVLVLDQVSDPRNIGAVLRSAAAFGAACVITQDRNAPEETGALAKAASGALESVPVIRAVNLARTLVALKAAGLWTVGLDAGAPPLSGPALAERRVAIVLGAEGPGMRRLVRETCDEIAGLAMPGSMDSLNVSAAATVALYELARRA